MKLYPDPLSDHPSQKYALGHASHVDFGQRNITPPFGVRYSKCLYDLKISPDILVPPSRWVGFPWEISDPIIDVSLSTYKKSDYSPDELLALSLEHLQAYKTSTCIYTDGSKSEHGVGFAATIPSVKDKIMKIHRKASIFTAELYAISAAIFIILTMPNISDFVIISDSLSSLVALQCLHPKNVLVYNIRNHLHRLRNMGKKVSLLWVPGHVGIPGNENADKLANTAVKFPESSIVRRPVDDYILL